MSDDQAYTCNKGAEDRAPESFNVSVDELKDHPKGGHGPPKDFLERQEEFEQRKEEFEQQHRDHHQYQPRPEEEDQ